MRLLLDTCTFLWLGSGTAVLGKTALELYLDPGNERYLSAASVWEIAIKHSNGRMPLPRSPELYIPQLRDRGDILSLSIDEEAAVYVAKLPRLHQDPFDRILIAQAVVHGMTILTPDDAVGQYAVRTVWD